MQRGDGGSVSHRAGHGSVPAATGGCSFRARRRGARTKGGTWLTTGCPGVCLRTGEGMRVFHETPFPPWMAWCRQLPRFSWPRVCCAAHDDTLTHTHAFVHWHASTHLRCAVRAIRLQDEDLRRGAWRGVGVCRGCSRHGRCSGGGCSRGCSRRRAVCGGGAGVLRGSSAGRRHPGFLWGGIPAPVACKHAQVSHSCENSSGHAPRREGRGDCRAWLKAALV